MGNKNIRVLLIEDDKEEIDKIREMLAEARNLSFDLECVDQISSGQKLICSGNIDVILLDASLVRGEKLDNHNEVNILQSEIPIILLCKRNDEEKAIKAIEKGAEDYLVKDQMNGNLLIRSIRYVLESKRADEALSKQSDVLGKKIRELNCLYAVFNVLEEQDISDEGVIQVVADLIPTAWEYPLIACARIILNGKEVKTQNFKETIWRQTANIIMMGEQIGTVEVFYLKEKPERDEGPFYNEERSLLDAISKRLGETIERKMAKEALQESEAKYRNLVERANDGILFIQDGIIKYANPRLLEMAGCSAEDIIDAPFIEFIHPNEISKVVDRYKRRMVGEKVEGLYETILKRKDGTYMHAEVNAGLISFRGYPADLVFIRDITERKIAETKLKETMQELERSNKELESFAYVASHDLQEPLRMITSYLQLLEFRYKGKLDDDADEFIKYAVDSAIRMQELIDGLLAYSRIGTHGKPFELVDCTAIFNRTLDDLKMAIEESGAIITNDPLPIVTADDMQIGQLYQNLIGNAIKFHGEEPPLIHVSAMQGNNEWVFSVDDNGIGIEPEYVDNIFTIFKRLHSTMKYPGTGIGLALSKKIVERHGGRIWVESEPGKGSTFYFTIPKSGGEHL